MDELRFHRALARPGTILDIGAHNGTLTLPLSELPGVVVQAFEPLPAAFARLRQAVGTRENIVLHPMALGLEAGSIRLEVPMIAGEAHEQWASMVKDYEAMRRADPRISGVQHFTVPVQPLDALEFADVTAIKLDAEGAEEEVLRGGTATLRRCRPVLSVEVEERHRAGSTVAVPAFLAELGYLGCYALDGVWHRVEGFDPAVLQRASVSPAAFDAIEPYVFTFFFVPPERRRELAGLADVTKL